MIRTRNQNKIVQPNENKPKNIKKPNLNKKQIETDVEQDRNKPNKPNNLKAQNNHPPKPIKSNPHFICKFDPQDQVEEYQDQIIRYVKELQPKYKINQNYLKFHNVMNVQIRNFLIKFIFKLTCKYKCRRSTLYLAVYCMDLYLSKSTTFQNNIESIAVAQASLHIAMKYQEIYPPPLKQWTNDADHIKKILAYQAQILEIIDFKLNLPSVYYFEQFFQKKFFQRKQVQQNKENLYNQELKINLVADLCLFDVSLYEYTPYQLAKNIRRLVYNVNPNNSDPRYDGERIILNIKWALQRNKTHLDWLKDLKYKQLKSN